MKDHSSRAVNDLCQEIGGCHVDCLNETVTIESLRKVDAWKVQTMNTKLGFNLNNAISVRLLDG